jgi:cell division protein ZapA
MMGQINVLIDGKQFRMACEDGQESHLESLAADLDSRIQQMRQSFGDIGDLRLSVMAGLMLADEVRDERRKADEFSAELAHREAERASSDQSGSRREAEIAAAISELALRVERVARALTGEERDPA